MRGTVLAAINLAGASVGQDLRLAAENESTRWTQARSGTNMNLQNAKVGTLQDSPDAWPTHIELEGFTYDHLGGFAGPGRAPAEDVRRRSYEDWSKWLNLSHTYSPQPYTQLANALIASGRPDTAAEVLFLGRDKGRMEVIRDCDTANSAWEFAMEFAVEPPNHQSPPPGDTTTGLKYCSPGVWLHWLGLSVLQATIGYGIGQYAFRAAYWLLGLTIIGTVVLSYAPGTRGTMNGGVHGPRQKSKIWCLAPPSAICCP